MILYLVLLFFESGAFPYGEIHSDRFLIHTPVSEDIYDVPGWWFWTSYWHGFATSISVSLFFVAAGSYEAVISIREERRRDAIDYAILAVLGVVLSIFVVFVAVDIAINGGA
jgi:hypothetical protein